MLFMVDERWHACCKRLAPTEEMIMRKKFVMLLMTVVTLFLAMNVQAQQYGISRFERLQTMSLDLRDQSRMMYQTARREFPVFRRDAYVINRLYRVYDEAANFQRQVERNYDNPEALRRAYQRLYSAWYEADYVMRNTNRFGYLNNEFRSVSYMVHRIGRSIPGYDYGRDRYQDDDYDYDYED